MNEMSINLAEANELLGRTPEVLRHMLGGLPDRLVLADEGPGTWSAVAVVGHLIHGERTDWIPRVRHIMAGRTEPFEPFDRFAQSNTGQGWPIAELLAEFAVLRRESLAVLGSFGLSAADLDRRGRHPDLGEVTLGQLIATWVVHDLDHIAQVARVIAKAHAECVGPWKAYLSILSDRTASRG